MSSDFHIDPVNEEYGFRFTYNILKAKEEFKDVIAAFDLRPKTEHNLDNLIIDMQDHRQDIPRQQDAPRQQQYQIGNNRETQDWSEPPFGGYLTAEDYHNVLKLNRRYSFYLGLHGTSFSKPGELPKVEPYYSKCLAEYERTKKEIRAKQVSKKNAHSNNKRTKAVRKEKKNKKKTFTIHAD
jgi:hypothetical protein